MKKTNHKRLLTLVLALVLVFALSLGAFAAWTQFQGGNDNNGVISVAPPTSTPTVTEIDLPRNGSPLEVYSGVDAETVINNGVAYTLYNGGIKNNNVGGARLHAATVSTGAQVWDIQLDNDADNESQLSTPYLDTVNGKLYATVSIRTPIFTDSDAVWTASGDASIDTATGVATFAAGTGVISTPITISDDVNYLYLPTNLIGGYSDGTYTIRLMSGGTLYRTLSSGAVTTYGTFDNYNGVQIQAGNYTLEIEVTGNTTAATMSQIVMNRYDWRLYCVSNLSVDPPTTTMLLGGCSLEPTHINTNYEGQITTPLYCDDGKLYFGVYGGTHSYYQYDLSTSTLVTFTPSVTPGSVGEDFYWAGAVKVTDSNNDDYIVFGGDSGKVYVRSKNAFGTTGAVIDLSTINPHQQPAVTPGQIRSSMVFYNGRIYFTSKGNGTNGWLWYIDTDYITNPGNSHVQVKTVMASKTSVSTPVISANGILYIGTGDYDTFSYTATGRIEAFAADLTSINQYVYVGDPVQSSPIVYSVTTGFPNTHKDYIYFTTNSGTGSGYCYSMMKQSHNALPVWTAGGTSNNCYTVQGFSSDGGYLIYGDDAGRLYIMTMP